MVAIGECGQVAVIAFYLPQYHPIPENDEWWGKGFTEWTNVARARPLFRGHYQPHIPADLGFYDLRVPEVRLAQAEMARRYGVTAFCYWHYWFGGRRILERPFNEVLRTKEPDFPFCLGWANQSWTGIWHGTPDRVLIEQTYPGLADHEAHFRTLLPAFGDHRYLTIERKPLLYFFQPTAIPQVKRVCEFWRELAHRAGLNGLYLVGEAARTWVPQEHGFDASVTVGLPPLRGWAPWRRPADKLQWYRRRILGHPTVYRYRDVLPMLTAPPAPGVWSHPAIVPNWDNTPRSGRNGRVLHGSTPEMFRVNVRQALSLVTSMPAERRIVFVKSWNEWAEGNHLEPDLRFGHGYLRALQEEMEGFERRPERSPPSAA